jgi:hypothetical protein
MLDYYSSSSSQLPIFAEPNLPQIKQTTKTKNKMTGITYSAHK